MKRVVGIALLACLTVPGTIQAAEPTELKTFKEKLSYSMGLDMGTYLNSIGDELEYDRLLQGLKTGFDGGEAILAPEEMQTVQREFAEKMKTKQEGEAKLLKDKNNKEGLTFLLANQKKEGVTTTESGLQYEVLTAGKGASPKETDTVKVHYTGSTIDGTVFDDSTQREPAVFGVNQVIPGWTEVLQLMNEGAKYKVVIPSALAYGARGVPPMIGPDSVLIFDVELISIEKEKTEEATKK